MPELIEIEYYRSGLEPALGRTITQVRPLDPRFVRGATSVEVQDALIGGTVTGLRRHGKLLLVDLSNDAVLGLRFGMTGRLILDGDAPIEALEYASKRDDPAWDRFGLDFAEGGHLAIRDQRRLGNVELDPDTSGLGPEASTITSKQLRLALGESKTSLKARLMDQSRVAGLGNLLTDESLWRAGFSPTREAGSLEPSQVTHLAKTIRSTVRLLTRRGGSHRGDIQDERGGGHCPTDGTAMTIAKVGGRTTVWCPLHQA